MGGMRAWDPGCWGALEDRNLVGRRREAADSMLESGRSVVPAHLSVQPCTSPKSKS